MRTKIAYLSVCITLVYWLGGMVGCATSPHDAQNEDMLKEDKSIFDTSPPSEGGNQFQSQTFPDHQLSLASIQTDVKVTESAASDMAPAPVVIPAPVANPGNDSAPSINSLDRGNWSTITVSPLIGQVKHGSTYYADQPNRQYTHTTVNLEDGQDAAMEAALDDTDYHLLSQREWATTLIQPLKFCWDTFTLPYNMTVKEPFWVDTKQGQ